MGKKLKNAPVYFTIAQVRHNPILSFESFIAGIQESMRNAGYPDFQRGFEVAFKLAAGAEAAGSQPPPPLRAERFSFTNIERTRGFLVQQNAISYQATDYDTFESFSDEFLKGLEILHKALRLDFSERIGFRYLDAVVPRQGEDLSQYLVPEVLGIGARVKDRVFAYSFAETLMLLGDTSKVVARVVVQQGPLAFPPDLNSEALVVAKRFGEINQRHAIIDTDGYKEGREVFDTAKVRGHLTKLHEEIVTAFRASVTDFAWKAWS